MNPDEWQDLQRRIAEQFDRALAGDRPAYCAACRRPFRCHEVTQPRSAFRTVWPARHSVAGERRDLCPGSEMQARLTP